MKISDEGIALIKQFEGCKLYAYRDSVGVATIGYGHTGGVKMGMSITQKQADEYLLQDVRSCEACLNSEHLTLTQHQFDALCCWILNLGVGAFRGSTMHKKLKEGTKPTDVTDQLVKWHYAGSKPLLGLKRRRVAEANMFLGRKLYFINNEGEIQKEGV